ncbi:MAG: TOBE domain-containing protein, partial [Chloroflexi bacterium]|nr:TOBE domain-containing protein [Chloroflexota bacterium]
NLLPGRILSLETRSPGVEVAVECGITVRSQVTQEAVRELSLRSGTRVWVVLKASSCFLVAQEPRSP